VQSYKKNISVETFLIKDIFIYVFNTQDCIEQCDFTWVLDKYKDELSKWKKRKNLDEFVAVRWFHHDYLGIKDKIAISDTKEPYCQGIPSMSISHSKGKIALAYSPKDKIGIDIEKTTNSVEYVKSKILFPSEFCLEETLIEPDIREKYFMRIWTAKEASYKASDSNKFSFKGYETLDLLSNKAECLIHEHKERFKLFFLKEDLFYFCLAIKSE
jgi:phosphopantetheinyl transferase